MTNTSKLEALLTAHFGQKCAVFEEGCTICKMWVLFEDRNFLRIALLYAEYAEELEKVKE